MCERTEIWDISPTVTRQIIFIGLLNVEEESTAIFSNDGNYQPPTQRHSPEESNFQNFFIAVQKILKHSCTDIYY